MKSIENQTSLALIAKRAFSEGYARARVKHRDCPARGEIAQYLIAEQPFAVLQQLWATNLVLIFLVGGYLRGKITNPFLRYKP